MRIDTLGNVLFDESYGTNGYNLVYYFILDDSGYIYINFKENGCEPSGYYLYTIDYDGNLIDSYHTSEDCAIWLVPSEYNDGFFMASVYDYFS